MQLDQSKRGFSFSKEGPLDMRMDASEELTAKSVVNSWPEQKLGDLFRDMGEEQDGDKQQRQLCVQDPKKQSKLQLS